jgi:ergothioneine biosynthesis protein EgtC
MCRFLVYKGRNKSMADLILKPEQSLIRQSYKARERDEPLNGDGFGIGWYTPEIDNTPCVFTSVQPAWSNRNLHRLAEKISSGCFFAHVRAASEGAFVNEFNCHPFQYNQFLWMHNGVINGFPKIKRLLRESLSDDYYNYIQGTTDSEHVFALFLDNLGDKINGYTADDLVATMIQTIRQVEDWNEKTGNHEYANLNFALSDGEHVIVTRYGSDVTVSAPSLYYSEADHFEVKDGLYHMRKSEEKTRAVIVASEPLTQDRSNWIGVSTNHLLLISPELQVQQLQIA